MQVAAEVAAAERPTCRGGRRVVDFLGPASRQHPAGSEVVGMARSSPGHGRGAGRDRVRDNLTESEQTEFWALLKKSHGKPSNLTKRDQTRVKDIVGKAIRG